jgi:hypothetical protein
MEENCKFIGVSFINYRLQICCWCSDDSMPHRGLPLTLGEERRLRVFENRLLSRVFGSKRDEVTRGVEKIT